MAGRQKNRAVARGAAKACRSRRGKPAQRFLRIGVKLPYSHFVAELMRTSGCSRGAAFTAFFRLFVWLDAVACDGQVFTTRDKIDAVAEQPGTADALERCGIIALNADGSTLLLAPNRYCEY